TLTFPALRASATLRQPALRAALAHLGHERTVAIAVASIVLGASFLSVAPAGARGDTGGPTGARPAPRLGIGGTITNDDMLGRVETPYVDQVPAATADSAAYARPAAATTELRLQALQVLDPAAHVS